MFLRNFIKTGFLNAVGVEPNLRVCREKRKHAGGYTWRYAD